MSDPPTRDELAAFASGMVDTFVLIEKLEQHNKALEAVAKAVTMARARMVAQRASDELSVHYMMPVREWEAVDCAMGKLAEAVALDAANEQPPPAAEPEGD